MGHIVEQLNQDVLWLGHSKIVLKSNNETSLVQVMDALSGALKLAGLTSVTNEGSVPYDPQTNGAAESAVRLLKGTRKANLLGLERQLKAKVLIDNPIVAWMVRYAATMRTLRIQGPDGKTAQQRVNGSSSITRLLHVGEVCRYKARSQESGISGSAWRWSVGMWLGSERRTGQYTLYDKTMGGVKAARTILRMPEPQQWSLDMVKELEATPWAVVDSKLPEVIHHQPAAEPTVSDKPAQVRRVYI